MEYIQYFIFILMCFTTATCSSIKTRTFYSGIILHQSLFPLSTLALICFTGIFHLFFIVFRCQKFWRNKINVPVFVVLSFNVTLLTRLMLLSWHLQFTYWSVTNMKFWWRQMNTCDEHIISTFMRIYWNTPCVSLTLENLKL